jgi:hypothetical protein
MWHRLADLELGLQGSPQLMLRAAIAKWHPALLEPAQPSVANSLEPTGALVQSINISEERSQDYNIYVAHCLGFSIEDDRSR